MAQNPNTAQKPIDFTDPQLKIFWNNMHELLDLNTLLNLPKVSKDFNKIFQYPLEQKMSEYKYLTEIQKKIENLPESKIALRNFGFKTNIDEINDDSVFFAAIITPMFAVNGNGNVVIDDIQTEFGLFIKNNKYNKVQSNYFKNQTNDKQNVEAVIIKTNSFNILDEVNPNLNQNQQGPIRNIKIIYLPMESILFYIMLNYTYNTLLFYDNHLKMNHFNNPLFNITKEILVDKLQKFYFKTIPNALNFKISEGGRKGANKTIVFNGKKYIIRTGEKGGQYIIINNKKRYVNKMQNDKN